MLTVKIKEMFYLLSNCAMHHILFLWSWLNLEERSAEDGPLFRSLNGQKQNGVDRGCLLALKNISINKATLLVSKSSCQSQMCVVRGRPACIKMH